MEERRQQQACMCGGGGVCGWVGLSGVIQSGVCMCLFDKSHLEPPSTSTAIRLWWKGIH